MVSFSDKSKIGLLQGKHPCNNPVLLECDKQKQAQNLFKIQDNVTNI